MQNGKATLEDILAVSYKTKHTLIIESNYHAPEGVENLCPHKNLHTGVYDFFHNCQYLEATKMPFSR